MTDLVITILALVLEISALILSIYILYKIDDPVIRFFKAIFFIEFFTEFFEKRKSILHQKNKSIK